MKPEIKNLPDASVDEDVDKELRGLLTICSMAETNEK